MHRCAISNLFQVKKKKGIGVLEHKAICTQFCEHVWINYTSWLDVSSDWLCLCIFFPSRLRKQPLAASEMDKRTATATVKWTYKWHAHNHKVDICCLYNRHPLIVKASMYIYVSADGHVCVLCSVPFHQTDGWIIANQCAKAESFAKSDRVITETGLHGLFV